MPPMGVPPMGAPPMMPGMPMMPPMMPGYPMPGFPPVPGFHPGTLMPGKLKKLWEGGGINSVFTPPNSAQIVYPCLSAYAVFAL
jgi:hypothetical protein